MSRTHRLIMRFGGITLIAYAMLGALPSPYPTLVGIAGVVLFFAAGST